MIRAPWTEAQVKNLADRQACGYIHEYTCGSCPGIKATLVPTPEGWYCPECKKVVQDWAHAMDVDGSFRELVDFRKRLTTAIDDGLEEL